MNTLISQVHDAGLGLRRSFLTEIVDDPAENISFYEVAPRKLDYHRRQNGQTI